MHDAYISDVQRITLNASCMTIWGGKTKQLDIIAGCLPRHWLYEWFSQFHSCGIYSVLSRSPSVELFHGPHAIFPPNFIFPNLPNLLICQIFKYRTVADKWEWTGRPNCRSGLHYAHGSTREYARVFACACDDTRRWRSVSSMTRATCQTHRRTWNSPWRRRQPSLKDRVRCRRARRRTLAAVVAAPDQFPAVLLMTRCHGRSYLSYSTGRRSQWC